ncbi:MAG TPA: hypothetical protein VI756_20825, partial [Blastocatellia bacterium]
MTDNPLRPARMPVIPSGPAYGWMARVNGRSSDLNRIELNPERRELLTSWTAKEFVVSALRITGIVLSASALEKCAAHVATQDANLSPEERSCAGLFAAFDALEKEARANGQQATVTADDFLRLYDLLNGGGSGAKSGIDGPQSKAEETAKATLERSCLWWTADSFRELHPVEQAALVHLRLIDLKVFGGLTSQMAFLASSLFLLRSTLPPLIISESAINAYLSALDE